MEGAQKFSFHRSFPRTDVTKSVDQGAQLVERENILKALKRDGVLHGQKTAERRAADAAEPENERFSEP